MRLRHPKNWWSWKPMNEVLDCIAWYTGMWEKIMNVRVLRTLLIIPINNKCSPTSHGSFSVGWTTPRLNFFSNSALQMWTENQPCQAVGPECSRNNVAQPLPHRDSSVSWRTAIVNAHFMYQSYFVCDNTWGQIPKIASSLKSSL